MKFTREFKVDLYHCDHNKVLLPSFIGRYCHETAYDALYAYGPNPDELLKRKLAFVLSRISYRIFKPIYSKQTLEVTTWAHPVRGVSFSRSFEWRADGIKVGEAASVWGLFSLESRSLLRAAELGQNDLRTDDDIQSVAPPVRWKLPSELTAAGEYIVSYTDIDINGHLNNVLAMNIIHNTIAANTDLIHSDKTVLGMDVNYVNEAAYGEKLKLAIAAEDDFSYFQATDAETGKVCLESRIRLSVFRS